MLIDSHCHLNRLDLTDFNHNLNEVLQCALEQGVEHMLTVSVVLDDIPVLQKIAEEYSNVSFSVGVHPTEMMNHEPNTTDLIALANHKSCIAIGETGLDYYRAEDLANQALQRARFAAHIQAARATQKPLIIHTRQAAEDTLKVMREEKADEIGGVMHCFSEDWDIAKQALDLNFYISFSGIVTFKNATQLQDVAKKVPLDRILIETDSPYLAPVPFRGKQNHPALVKYVAKAIGQLRGIDIQTVANATSANFHRCFRINQA